VLIWESFLEAAHAPVVLLTSCLLHWARSSLYMALSSPTCVCEGTRQRKRDRGKVSARSCERREGRNVRNTKKARCAKMWVRCALLVRSAPLCHKRLALCSGHITSCVEGQGRKRTPRAHSATLKQWRVCGAAWGDDSICKHVPQANIPTLLPFIFQLPPTRKRLAAIAAKMPVRMR
jgi:hypothetical protein